MTATDRESWIRFNPSDQSPSLSATYLKPVYKLYKNSLRGMLESYVNRTLDTVFYSYLFSETTALIVVVIIPTNGLTNLFDYLFSKEHNVNCQHTTVNIHIQHLSRKINVTTAPSVSSVNNLKLLFLLLLHSRLFTASKTFLNKSENKRIHVNDFKTLIWFKYLKHLQIVRLKLQMHVLIAMFFLFIFWNLCNWSPIKY